MDGLTERLLAVAAQDGVDAVAKALITEVAGESAWLAFPDEIRRLLDVERPGDPRRTAGRMVARRGCRRARHASRQPTLLVAAADSPPEFREPVEALAAALPNARTALVGGGHLIDPAAPEVLAFIDEVLG